MAKRLRKQKHPDGISKSFWKRIQQSEQDKEFEVFVWPKDDDTWAEVRRYFKEQETAIKADHALWLLTDLTGVEIIEILGKFNVMVIENSRGEIKLG